MPISLNARFDHRKASTIMAALRAYQGIARHDHNLRDIASNGGTLNPLDGAEINRLYTEIEKGQAPTDLHITVPDGAWQRSGKVETGRPDDTPESRLLVQIDINGTAMHLEAYEVHDDENAQDPTNSAFKPEVEALHDIVDSWFQTTKIMGRTYILCAVPHGD